MAFAVAFVLEANGRLLRQARPPLVTRYATWLMGRDLEYSTEKAADPARLGARPDLPREHRADGPLVRRARTLGRAPSGQASVPTV